MNARLTSVVPADRGWTATVYDGDEPRRFRMLTVVAWCVLEHRDSQGEDDPYQEFAPVTAELGALSRHWFSSECAGDLLLALQFGYPSLSEQEAIQAKAVEIYRRERRASDDTPAEPK